MIHDLLKGGGDATDILEALKAKKASPREVFSYYRKRTNELDERLNTFISLAEPDDALKQVDAYADRPLAGLPVGVKDNFCIRGTRTTCASRMLENWRAPYTCTLFERLENAGGSYFGKCNLDEFCMGSANETSYMGQPENPWQIGCTPGGSSGGSAAAVAAGLVPFALGSDTGGSVRQPAAHCGVTGFKPTYGRISRYGMIAFASSLDQAGVVALSARDAKMVYEAMAGNDHNDSTSLTDPLDECGLNDGSSLEDVTIGIVPDHINENVPDEFVQALQQARNVFEARGAKFVEVSLSDQSLIVPCYHIISAAEASTNLARYDGVRYGFRTDEEVKGIADMYERTRSAGFGREVKRRIMLGTWVLASEYMDAYYRRAQRVRRLIKDSYEAAFNQCDAILSFATIGPAFKHGQKGTNPVAMYMEDLYTAPANLAGLPSISFPAGTSSGLPFSLQLTTLDKRDDLALTLAEIFQRETDWHRRRCEIFQEEIA